MSSYRLVGFMSENILMLDNDDDKRCSGRSKIAFVASARHNSVGFRPKLVRLCETLPGMTLRDSTEDWIIVLLNQSLNSTIRLHKSSTSAKLAFY